MAENAEKARMADIVSKEIFETFGWRLSGTKNKDFSCLQAGIHKKVRTQKKEHPTDCVFTYVDPRSGQRVYLNTDLKSLGCATLTDIRLGPILKSLGHATECARHSPDWKALFGVDESVSHRVEGMLFIYNHDAEAKHGFIAKLEALAPSSMELSTLPLVYAIGPERSIYLHAVADDIRRQHGLTLDDPADFTYYFPHLKRTRAVHNFSKCVPIDHLLGPLIVACGKTAGNNATKTHVYYDGPGAAPEEFEYVIDSLFRYQVITNQTSIDMVLAEPNARASVHFQTARERYARDKWHTISPQQETSTTMVNNISYRSLPTQARRIYEVEIGL